MNSFTKKIAVNITLQTAKNKKSIQKNLNKTKQSLLSNFYRQSFPILSPMSEERENI